MVTLVIIHQPTAMNRWAEYCTELFENKDLSPSTSETHSDEGEGPEPPSLLSEVRHAMHQLRSEKSPGIDDIPAELWKATGDEGIHIMWQLCTKIWKTAQWPIENS